MKYEEIKRAACSRARLGRLHLNNGMTVETPVFMPVGTCGAIKGLMWRELEELDCEIVLANTYHMALRPGGQIVEQAGGLRSFTTWPKAFLTDSGGFQVFSLSSLRKITDEGVHFRSHIDGSKCFIGPKESMEIQRQLGSDIVMAFDECVACPANRDSAQRAVKRTTRWAEICRNYPLKEHQSIFGIIQGAHFLDLRKAHLEEMRALGFPGYAIGGLSVGEPAEVMYEVLDHIADELPRAKPRYLMGVGTPRNLIEAVMRGVDMFDCVMPTRNGRNGTAFTWDGKINIKAARYKEDMSPLDPHLKNRASQSKKAYIRHLVHAQEINGLSLVSWQNLAFYLDLMKKIREAIAHDRLEELYAKVCMIYPQ